MLDDLCSLKSDFRVKVQENDLKNIFLSVSLTPKWSNQARSVVNSNSRVSSASLNHI